MKGIILKGIGGFYYVKADGAVYECRAKGIFRLEGVKPVPGDWVRFTPPTDTSLGSVDEILPRRNQLVRPAVANVDLLLIILSAKKPKADLLLADKLLAYAYLQNIPAAIVVNKCDTGGETRETVLAEYGASGAEVVCVSARTGENLGRVKELMRGRCTCLAGQSAVGKSSLINALSPGLELETGGLSKKTDRGRHTTRHSELLYLAELDAVAVDTPGFSILECADMAPEELSRAYREFDGVRCRFGGCLHQNEPDCGVKERVAQDIVPQGGYDRYLELLQELQKRRERQYD